MISHHPSQDLLKACATGHISEALALIIETHAALCPRCRDDLRQFEAIGGLLLEQLPPTPISGNLPETFPPQLQAPEGPTESHGIGGMDTPAPLRSYLQGTLSQLRWIPVAPGLGYRPLLAGSCSARLLCSKPGGVIDTHTHKGEEYSLVVTGGYRDGSGHYLRGDFQTADGRLLHNLTADDDGDCIVLVVTNARLIFRNPISGLIARLIGC